MTSPTKLTCVCVCVAFSLFRSKGDEEDEAEKKEEELILLLKRAKVSVVYRISTDRFYWISTNPNTAVCVSASHPG